MAATHEKKGVRVTSLTNSNSFAIASIRFKYGDASSVDVAKGATTDAKHASGEPWYYPVATDMKEYKNSAIRWRYSSGTIYVFQFGDKLYHAMDLTNREPVAWAIVDAETKEIPLEASNVRIRSFLPETCKAAPSKDFISLPGRWVCAWNGLVESPK
jgi:hypothetical protein